jgi:hypothetical protein
VALLPPQVRMNLAGNNFIDDFNQHDAEYLSLARLLARASERIIARTGGSLPPIEEFAERFLVPVIANALLSVDFVRFREALDAHPYIDRRADGLWARSMARHILQEAIRRGSLL